MAQAQSEVSSMPRISTMNSATASEPDAQHLRQRQEEDEGDEGGEHEHVAVGEVHHADDAEHHRVADGDEAVDRAQRDAVDELLEESIPCGRRPFPRVAWAEASRGRGAATTQEGGQNAVWLPNNRQRGLGAKTAEPVAAEYARALRRSIYARWVTRPRFAASGRAMSNLHTPCGTGLAAATRAPPDRRSRRTHRESTPAGS